MKLKYNILWIDDQIDDIIGLGVKDEIQEYLEDLEFIPTIDCYQTKQLAEEKLKNATYDLILSDFNIGEDDKGNVLIEWIRKEDIFTEVLFYSAQRDYEKTLVGTDRISYFGLYNDEAYRGFKEKVYWLIRQTVYKFEELTPMRGFVMAETSILDSKVESILADYFQDADEERDKMGEGILKKIEDSLLDNFKKNDGFNKELLTLKLRNKSTLEIVKSRIYDASKKARTIEDLIKSNGLEKMKDFENFFENYQKDVLEIRNKLAHAKSEVIDNTEWLILDDENSEKYGTEECKEIRKCLKKYSNCLDQLQALISKTE